MVNLVTFGIEIAKKEFNLQIVNLWQKGDFLGNIMKHLCANKVLDYLTDEIELNSNKDYSIGNYFIES